MAHVRSDVRLVIAGSPDHEHAADQASGPDRGGTRCRLSGRRLRGTWLPEQEKRELFAEERSHSAYVPYDEDSYGYVTLESVPRGRPVVTCSDSGGTLKLVEDRGVG